jgi:hypothetical protein
MPTRVAASKALRCRCQTAKAADGPSTTYVAASDRVARVQGVALPLSAAAMTRTRKPTPWSSQLREGAALPLFDVVPKLRVTVGSLSRLSRRRAAIAIYTRTSSITTSKAPCCRCQSLVRIDPSLLSSRRSSEGAALPWTCWQVAVRVAALKVLRCRCHFTVAD